VLDHAFQVCDLIAELSEAAFDYLARLANVVFASRHWPILRSAFAPASFSTVTFDRVNFRHLLPDFASTGFGRSAIGLVYASFLADLPAGAATAISFAFAHLSSFSGSGARLVLPALEMSCRVVTDQPSFRGLLQRQRPCLDLVTFSR
jgi:hypothetical protein